MPDADFERTVFINCPFDDEFAPLLQAMLFVVVLLGFQPRIATERQDGGENRLAKIVELIRSAKYSIHDLSRCQARKARDLSRLNMPFELGIDYGCRVFSREPLRQKRFLILEEKRYRYQAALSDIAGCDINHHGGDFQKVVACVRNWFASEPAARDAPVPGPARILSAYADFLAWYYEKKLAEGAAEEDIKSYPTAELLQAMHQWRDLPAPVV